jgi:outer membrane lipoprotein SlyB
MNWKDIAGVVGKAAPIVGGILGGPAGSAVGALVATALGTDATPDAVSAALLQDPAAAVKLKELEVNSRIQLQQLAVAAEQNRLQASAAQYAAGWRQGRPVTGCGRR